jgi:hypothetical protein
MRLAGTIVAAGLVVSAAPATAMDLVSGTAIYELSLDPAKGMAGVGGAISGRLESGLFRTCEGYDTTTRLDAKIMPSTGGALSMKLDSDLAETSGTLRFKVAGRFGLQVLQDTQGVATLTPGGVTVKLERPKTEELALDGGPVVFPTALVTRAIERRRPASASSLSVSSTAARRRSGRFRWPSAIRARRTRARTRRPSQRPSASRT